MITRLGRAYAKAFLGVVPASEAQASVEQLRVFASALERVPRLATMAANPAVPMDVKREILQEVGRQLAIGKWAAQLLALLLANFRLVRLPEILEAVDELLRRKRGIAAVRLTSAAILDDELAAQVRNVLERALGQTVDLAFAVDPRLIGGFVAQIGSRRYDGSIRGQLERMSVELAAAANQA